MKTKFAKREMRRRVQLMACVFSLLFGLALWGVGRGVKAKNSHSAAITAMTIHVTNTNDSGAASLRQALADAAPGDKIGFNLPGCPCTITLTSDALVINKSLTIQGLGANQLTISGNNNRQVFFIDTGNTVTLNGLTITGGGGNSSLTSGYGGGIAN